MKNKSVSIPVAMVMKKFYCHKCGVQLKKCSKTRTVKPGDPDYKKHNRVGGHSRRIGAIEVTEYDYFQCPACNNIIDYDGQCAVKTVQKRLRKNVLTEKELLDNESYAEKKRKSKGKTVMTLLVVGTVVASVIVFILGIKFKWDMFGFKYYF